VETRPIASEIWERLPPEVQAYILVLENSLRQALAKIDRLEQKVNALEERLNRTSNNSSLPPSGSAFCSKAIGQEKSGKPEANCHQGNHQMVP
jgi:hypothetical protein